MRTTIDKFIIQRVKEIRENKGLTKEQVDIKLEFSSTSSFVGHAETDGNTKYNIYHLNELAKIFNCDIADFFPRPYQEENSLKEYRDNIAESRRKAKEKRK